jgi:AcrR family transcriptional regulator
LAQRRPQRTPIAVAKQASPERSQKRQVRRIQPERRKDEILRKAIEFFAEVGFDGGTRELAKRLGVTQPLLYRYFLNKEALVREVYESVYLNRWQPRWDKLLLDRSQPLRERLQRFYEEYTDVIFTKEWMRIYFFAGLKGVKINSLYLNVVEERILKPVIWEFRHEVGMPKVARISSHDLDLAWFLQGGIFYYGVREHICGHRALQDKSAVISDALTIFLNGMRVAATRQAGSMRETLAVSNA